MKKSHLLGAVCACITLFATNVFAADKYWSCGDGSWDDASCWNPGGLPTIGDNVFLIQSGTTNKTVTYINPQYQTNDVLSLTIDSTGSGTIILTQNQDALLHDGQILYVGTDGVGVFNQSGGSVGHNIGYFSVSLGSNSTGNGTYNLSGGSLNAELMGVGSHYGGLSRGTGTFNMTGGTAGFGFMEVGSASGVGIVNLSNGSLGGSELIISQNGIFNQTDGSASYAGLPSIDLAGTYNLSGGNLLENTSVIGGTFNHNGGNHTSSFGLTLHSDGTYNLSGTSILTSGSAGFGDVVGHVGVGTFNHLDGAHITSILNLGGGDALGLRPSDGTGNGTYNLSGGSLSAQNEVIGYDGIGTFNQTGGTNTITDTMTLAEVAGSNGTYNLDGGRLDATNIVVNSGGSFNFDGGTLLVDNFTGNLVNNGGTLEPGTSPGITNIFGDYTQSIFGTYIAEIAGLAQGSEYDLLNVTGAATLGGILDVNLLSTSLFTPSLGDTFDILMADTITGEFDILLLATLGGGLGWDVSYIFDPFNTDIVRLSVVQAVPVPAAVWLFGSGLLGLVSIVRRKKAA